MLEFQVTEPAVPNPTSSISRGEHPAYKNRMANWEKPEVCSKWGWS